MALEKRDLDEKQFEELTPEELAEWEKAQKKFRARMRGMTIFCLILAVPIFIGAWLVWRMHLRTAADRAWAVAEMAKPSPDPMAYGALGSIFLNEGRVAEALPLLTKAAALEKAQGMSVQAHVVLAEAHLEGLKQALPGASREAAIASIREMLGYADKLPQGPDAAAWHAAGKLYAHLGMRVEATECLKKAADLQADDWVDEGNGHRYKHRGIASTYQKDYSGALYQ